MSILKFKGHSKASGANVAYITRESACDSISFHNLKELDSENQYDKKVNALSYSHNREEEEPRRTHYRVTLSWENKEDTDKAKEMTHNFLEKEFPKARAVIAIHQDTDQTHAHVWLDSRQTDDKKIHSSKEHLNQICKSWQQQYDREYRTDHAREFEQKREETRQYKIDRINGIEREKPNRAAMTARDFREKDYRDAGAKTNEFDKERLDRNQRYFEVGDKQSEKANRAITRSEQQINQSKQEFNRAVDNSHRTESAFRETRERLNEVRSRTTERQQLEQDKDFER